MCCPFLRLCRMCLCLCLRLRRRWCCWLCQETGLLRWYRTRKGRPHYGKFEPIQRVWREEYKGGIGTAHLDFRVARRRGSLSPLKIRGTKGIMNNETHDSPSRHFRLPHRAYPGAEPRHLPLPQQMPTSRLRASDIKTGSDWT